MLRNLWKAVFSGESPIEDVIAAHLNPLRQFLDAHIKTQEDSHVAHRAKAHAQFARDAKSAADKARGVAGHLAGLLK